MTMRQFMFLALLSLALLYIIGAGGKPSKGTPADKRLSANKPKAPVPAPQQQTRITKAYTPPKKGK